MALSADEKAAQKAEEERLAQAAEEEAAEAQAAQDKALAEQKTADDKAAKEQAANQKKLDDLRAQVAELEAKVAPAPTEDGKKNYTIKPLPEGSPSTAWTFGGRHYTPGETVSADEALAKSLADAGLINL
ncbi:MAG: hypothetical protein KY445_02740 [Armatimonadetes bacterium]|nr:hypothetical protein [Armatimonadota bacterium]